MMTFALAVFLMMLTSSHQATNDGGGGCLLPDQPEGGEYTVVGGCEGDGQGTECRPGTQLDALTELTYKCFTGYRLLNSNASLCYQGNWFPQLPSCLKLCKPLHPKSQVIVYINRGSTVDDNTSEGVLPGTQARCKPFYIPDNNIFSMPTCGEDGTWSAPFSCKPTCGQMPHYIKPLIPEAIEHFAGYPWHVSLYIFDKGTDDFEFICGGTIVSHNMILTAAHCIHKQGELHVAVGKTTRSWKIMDPDEQRFQVSNIFIHPGYQGNKNYYAFDIAVLELRGYITMGKAAMPVCPPSQTIPDDTILTVAGYYRDESRNVTSRLSVFHMGYLSNSLCRSKVPKSLEDFVTREKFCATSDPKDVILVNGGGGLFFYDKRLDRYFLQGITSSKFQDERITTFANISEISQAKFLNDVLSEQKRKLE